MLAAKALQRRLARLPVRLHGLHQRVEGRTVMMLLQMAQLMDDDVRDERGRVLDEAGVEGEDAVAAAVAPTAAHGAVTQRRLFAYPRTTRRFMRDHGG